MYATQSEPVHSLARRAGLALRQGFSRMLDLGVPPQCLICDAILAEPGGCCAFCWQKIRFIAEPLCPVSGRPFSHEMGPGMVSAQVIADPPPYAMCRSAVVYDDNTRRLVTSLKYGDRTELAPWLANWMVAAGRELLLPGRVIVPVPLHRSRLLQRRFNQSAELARAVARGSGLTYRPGWLVRHRPTRQQVGLSSSERARNVQGSFRVPSLRKPEVTGSHVVLIDDVYTSGSTVKSATRTLLKGGAASVCVLTFARVETHAV